MISLYLEAPFAACRTFTAGWYRPTATFLTPSMIYGLVLNLAGIESRLCEEAKDHPGTAPATLTRPGLPAMRIAIGVPIILRKKSTVEEMPELECYPQIQTIYQQLHNYPVGSSGNDRAELTFGNKYNITPVRREILCNVRVVAMVDGGEEIENCVCNTLANGASSSRYGLPFLGDNSFLPDRIDVLDTLPMINWYECITETDEKIRPRTTRLTVWIDRADMSKTVSHLYAPTEKPTTEPPDSAWTRVGPPAQES